MKRDWQNEQHQNEQHQNKRLNDWALTLNKLLNDWEFASVLEHAVQYNLKEQEH